MDGLLVVLIVIGAYFLPAIAAGTRKHHNGGAIFVLNLLLGWTLLCWVLALVWACTQVNARAEPVQVAPAQPILPGLARALVVLGFLVAAIVGLHYEGGKPDKPKAPTVMAWSQSTVTTPAGPGSKPNTTGTVTLANTSSDLGDFRGLRWGGAPTKEMQKVGGPNGAERPSVWKNAKRNPQPFHGIPVAEEAYMFEDGRLYAGEVFIDGADNFAKIRAALTKQYGTPDFANEKAQVYRWKRSGTLIQLHHQASFQRSTVHVERK